LLNDAHKLYTCLGKIEDRDLEENPEKISTEELEWGSASSCKASWSAEETDPG
jgi:hypothetical protein